MALCADTIYLTLGKKRPMGIVMLQGEGESKGIIEQAFWPASWRHLIGPPYCVSAQIKGALSFKSTLLKSSENPPWDHKERIDSKANL